MSIRTILPVVLLAALPLASCESSVSPMAPSPAMAEAVALPAGDPDGAGAATSRKPEPDGPFVIKHGELEFFGSPARGEVRLKDQRRGFSLLASVTGSGGIVSAVTSCVASNCKPGDTIPLYAYGSGNDFHATVTLDGTSYPRLGDLSGRYGSAWVRFNGTAVAPPLHTRGSVQVRAPFTMEGGFWVPEHPFMPYSGAGVVTVWLTHDPWSTGWRVTRLLYELRNQPPRVGQADLTN
jgi:hypothetical protein